MPEIVNADHIAGLDGKFEPQRTNNFTVRVTPPDGGEQVIALSVAEVNFPQEQSAIIEVPFANETRKVAGRASYSNETLVVYDYVGSETADVFDKWRNRIQNKESGAISYAKDYKRDAQLILYGPDGNVKRTWRLVGMWPTRVRYGQGNMANPAQNKLELEFACDKIIYEGIRQ